MDHPWLGGNMSPSDGLNAGSSPRGGNRGSPFLLLAAALMIFAAIAGTALLLWRPTTLRIAVGPPGSDDQKLIQELAQSFANEGSPVRLTVLSTAGAVESVGLLGTGETDMAVVRADEEMPKGTGAVAILRKNVVVLWAPSGAARKDGKKASKSKIKEIGDLAGHRVGVVGRTPVNVTLLRVILTESGVNPDKVAVSQFSISQIAEMLRDPPDRCIHDGRTARQQDHHRGHHLDRACQGRADISRNRRIGSPRPQASAL